MEIFALLICYQFVATKDQWANRCEPVDLRNFTYTSAEACQAKHQNVLGGPQPSPPDVKLTYHCASKTVPTWKIQ
jgi:hypothetical protein